MTITFKKQSDYGINSTRLNVYSNRRLIGYCGPESREAVKERCFAAVTPINEWNNCFSIKLKKEFGLPLRTNTMAIY